MKSIKLNHSVAQEVQMVVQATIELQGKTSFDPILTPQALTQLDLDFEFLPSYIQAIRKAESLDVVTILEVLPQVDTFFAINKQNVHHTYCQIKHLFTQMSDHLAQPAPKISEWERY